VLSDVRIGARYGFNHGNPYAFRDPSGRCPICPGDPFEYFFGRVTDAASGAAEKLTRDYVVPVTDFVPGVGAGVRFGLGDAKAGTIMAATDALTFGLAKLSGPIIAKLAGGSTDAVATVGRGSVALDNNVLIKAIGSADQSAAILAGRTPVVSITAAKEYVAGGRSALTIGEYLAANGGRIGSVAKTSTIETLQQQAASVGRSLGANDARIAASAIQENIPLVTDDKKLGRFLDALKYLVEGKFK
jgi:predicted nucleic acid-binding protein